MTVHRVKFLIIKPTGCTNFSNLFLEWMQCSSILSLLASCQQTCVTYTVTVFTVKTPDDGQRNCPKHVEFHSKNKFEKLVHLVGFIKRNLNRARSKCLSFCYKFSQYMIRYFLCFNQIVIYVSVSDCVTEWLCYWVTVSVSDCVSDWLCQWVTVLVSDC